jgi:hypothetical protein
MIYIQIEEKIFSGKTFKSLVRQMWDTSFDNSINKQNFMFNVKTRIKELYDKRITTEDYQGFIEDLDKLGLVKIIRCADCENYTDNPRHCMAGIDIVIPTIMECPHMMTKQIQIEKVNTGEAHGTN